MWDRVASAWVALVRADPVLIGILTPTAANPAPPGVTFHLYAASAARPVSIPSIEYVFVSDVEEELFNPLIMQVDYWATGVQQATTIERQIRRLTHRDVSRTLGGIRMWTRYLESRSHPYPAKLGVVHRSVDFEFTPVRGQYAS